MVALALLHGAVILFAPSATMIALGVWWNSNTISHNFIHQPFFRRRSANVLFGAYLSVLLGIPQAWWRARHLAHHGMANRDVLDRRELTLQIGLVFAFWAALAICAPATFATAYVPGYVAGLMLCGVHGYYEHARGTISHYGFLYNFVCFNDGYHSEHHRHPGVSWQRLPDYRPRGSSGSPWPAPLRWIEELHGRSLAGLERLVLRSRILQRLVINAHARALKALTAARPIHGHIAIVGGGLFPRTALVLREVLPTAKVTIIDANREHLDTARRILDDDRVTFIHRRFTCDGRCATDPGDGFDAIVIPLAFDGDRNALYARPPARTLLVHDWIWRRRGESRVVSPLLLKRLNLVSR